MTLKILTDGEDVDMLLGEEIAEPKKEDSDYSEPFTYDPKDGVSDSNFLHPHIN